MGNPKLHYSVEEKPLGTAGAVMKAANILRSPPSGGLFFVLNSDVVGDFPLEAMMSFHA